MRKSILNTCFCCCLYLVLSLTTSTHAQSISPQVLEFDKICAGVNNSFNASFNHTGFPGGTTFEVILSDSSGFFTNPIATTTLSSVDVTSSQKKITFAVPTNLVGADTYKLKVKTSTGYTSPSFNILDLTTGGTKSSFSAYFKSYEDVYFINNKQGSASMCAGGSVTLSIDNTTPSVVDSSPVNYSNLKYKWFKNDVAISGETLSSINVNSAGTYYVVIDYGPCTDSNSRSNSVVVTQSAGGSSGSVISSLGNPFCPSAGATTLSAVTGNSYQWSKNNNDIIGATNATYVTDQAGSYKVRVNFGGCISTFSINLSKYEIVSSINISDPSIILDGESLTVVATTDAISPTFVWYKDNMVVSGNNTNTYIVSSEGSYSVKITQNSGCVIVDQIPFVIYLNEIPNLNPVQNASVIPNLISLSGSLENQIWALPNEYYDTNTEVQIINSNGQTVYQTNNYLNNWPENSLNFTSVNPVYYYIIAKPNEKPKQGSITIVR